MARFSVAAVLTVLLAVPAGLADDKKAELKKPLGTTKFIDVIIGAHVVPSCAMKVQRSTEMGDLSPYTPAAGTACGCYFDEKIKGAGEAVTKANAMLFAEYRKGFELKDHTA